MSLVSTIIGQTPNDSRIYPAAGEWLRLSTRNIPESRMISNTSLVSTNALVSPLCYEELIPAHYGIPLLFGCSFTSVTIIFGAVHLYFVLRFISDENIQTDLYWIVFMCPVVSLCAAMGMVLPRSAVFLYAIALVYFMLCIFAMVTLMTTLHGGRIAMCEKLIRNDVKLSLKVSPFGCCLFCLPKLKATDQNFRRLEWLVFQSPVVRIFLEILNIVVFFEVGNRNTFFFQFTNLVGMISLFVGSYGSYIIIPPGSRLLSAYRFSLMFRIVDFSQLAYSVQKFLFDFLAAIGIFDNDPVLPSSGTAQFFTSFLLVMEMFMVSIAGTYLFRPSQTVFFDRYAGSPGYRPERLIGTSESPQMCCVCRSVEVAKTAVALSHPTERARRNVENIEPAKPEKATANASQQLNKVQSNSARIIHRSLKVHSPTLRHRSTPTAISQSTILDFNTIGQPHNKLVNQLFGLNDRLHNDGERHIANHDGHFITNISAAALADNSRLLRRDIYSGSRTLNHDELAHPSIQIPQNGIFMRSLTPVTSSTTTSSSSSLRGVHSDPEMTKQAGFSNIPSIEHLPKKRNSSHGSLCSLTSCQRSAGYPDLTIDNFRTLGRAEVQV